MLSTEAQRELFDCVKQFNDFTKENDPYGEHDFGSIKFQNDIYFGRLIIMTLIFYITVQTRATLLLQIGF